MDSATTTIKISIDSKDFIYAHWVDFFTMGLFFLAAVSCVAIVMGVILYIETR